MRTGRVAGAGLGLAVVLVLVMAAWSGTAVAQDEATPTPTPFWQTNDDPDLNAQMDRVEQATSILRDLEPVEPVTRAFIDPDQLLDYLIADLNGAYPPQAARDDVIFYHAFGFMDLDVDLRAVQLDVLAEQIAGFYDTDLEAMFVISDEQELDALNQLLYAHEYTHVLQDQRFDLDALGINEVDLAADPD
ncbi:MAG: hypothetical protein JW910_11480, partial [Anaerolineae bacterium]|nr:hypothetical protein [Anaerolineae bacterium]